MVIGSIVLSHMGSGSSGDGYRPTDRALQALELSRQGKKREAFEIYREEAEKGDRFAQFAVGNFLSPRVAPWTGEDKTDIDSAIDWYSRAAEQGQVAAQYALARIFLDEPEYRNPDRALKWMRRSADLGYSRAQYGLALMFYDGRHFEKDHERSIEWARKAADQGEGNGFNIIGLIYEHGASVDADHDRAMEYFEEAAERGSVDGLINLTRLTFEDDSLTTTRLDRHVWSRILERVDGDELARRDRRRLERSMGWWDVRRGRLRAWWWLCWYGDEFE